MNVVTTGSSVDFRIIFAMPQVLIFTLTGEAFLMLNDLIVVCNVLGSCWIENEMAEIKQGYKLLSLSPTIK